MSMVNAILNDIQDVQDRLDEIHRHLLLLEQRVATLERIIYGIQPPPPPPAGQLPPTPPPPPAPTWAATWFNQLRVPLAALRPSVSPAESNRAEQPCGTPAEAIVLNSRSVLNSRWRSLSRKRLIPSANVSADRKSLNSVAQPIVLNNRSFLLLRSRDVSEATRRVVEVHCPPTAAHHWQKKRCMHRQRKRETERAKDPVFMSFYLFKYIYM